MFLRKIDGPRVVILPDGRSLSRADLPAGNAMRWTSQRKRLVAEAVQAGLIARDHAMCLYELSALELDTWCERYRLEPAEPSGFGPVGASAIALAGPGN